MSNTNLSNLFSSQQNRLDVLSAALADSKPLQVPTETLASDWPSLRPTLLRVFGKGSVIPQNALVRAGDLRPYVAALRRCGEDAEEGSVQEIVAWQKKLLVPAEVIYRRMMLNANATQIKEEEEDVKPVIKEELKPVAKVEKPDKVLSSSPVPSPLAGSRRDRSSAPELIAEDSEVDIKPRIKRERQVVVPPKPLVESNSQEARVRAKGPYYSPFNYVIPSTVNYHDASTFGLPSLPYVASSTRRPPLSALTDKGFSRTKPKGNPKLGIPSGSIGGNFVRTLLPEVGHMCYSNGTVPPSEPGAPFVHWNCESYLKGDLGPVMREHGSLNLFVKHASDEWKYYGKYRLVWAGPMLMSEIEKMSQEEYTKWFRIWEKQVMKMFKWPVEQAWDELRAGGLGFGVFECVGYDIEGMERWIEKRASLEA
ncbi:hypothetical protein MNV49_005840 [Pseudohyphozyma bogoriensis]|nr:hypothetical protein MNV49_005840 [Pseudohyphozyma bogoriensis]